jgi:hypothetical protein
MAHRRAFVIAILLFAVGCAASDTAGSQTRTVANDPDACTFNSDCTSNNCQFGHCSPFPDPSSNSCTLDSQCGTGSCRMGSCSIVSPGCSFDSDCPGGSCQTGTCSPFPPSSGCTSDAQCGGGSCQMGSCSPFPP